MGMRTRSTNNSPVKGAAIAHRAISATVGLPQEIPRILVAPTETTGESRILSLKHPRDEATQRFLFCPQNGLFEITKISGGSSDPRSALFAREDLEDNLGDSQGALKTSISAGYISSNAEMLTATPFEASFLLLRILAPESPAIKKPMFQPLDDILDIHIAADKQLQYLALAGRHLIEAAMVNICDIMEAGDERLFRYSEEKLLNFWIKRAEQAVQAGLPSSMEEKFVTRALEAPVPCVVREETETSAILVSMDKLDSPSDSFDSQSVAESSTTSQVFSEASSTSTNSTSVNESPISHFHDLQRLRIALAYISASYMPKYLANRLEQLLKAETSPVDFKPLDLELKRIACLRSEAAAQRSLSDFSRKRSNIDDEAAELRAEKKRKLEEDEKKRKANESRGVRELKKVNVSGMKKMSDFFSKKPATSKA